MLLIDPFLLCQLMTMGLCISLGFCSHRALRKSAGMAPLHSPHSSPLIHFPVNKARQQPRATCALYDHSLLHPWSCEKTRLFSSQQAGFSETDMVSCCFLLVRHYLDFLQNDAQTNLKRTNKKSSNLQVLPDRKFPF